MKENVYIFYRKVKALINQFCFLICSIFPIKGRRIAICTFEGKSGFGCNPKYIVEELHKRDSEYEFVWLVDDTSKAFPPYIKKASNSLLSRAYWLSTSKIWIDNYRKPYGTRKRKKQCYINTWHGTIGFKTTGLWRGAAFSKMAYLVSINDSKMIDYITIDSEWCAQMFPKGLLYDGAFLKSGAPRCDVLYGERTFARQKYRQKLQIDENIKLIMFAPTFRESSLSGVRSVSLDSWTIDFVRMLDNITMRFGGDWSLCIRLHPQISELTYSMWDKSLKDKVIDISKEDDMYEALAAMDILITDYSSVAMEAGFMGIPVFIYADDIDRYVNDRGSLLWDMSMRKTGKITNNKEMTPKIEAELPFSISEDNDELEKAILSFDDEVYRIRLKEFHQAVDLVFDGNASKRAADKIEELIRFNDKE